MQCATPMEAFGEYQRKTIIAENKKKDEIHLLCVMENILNLQLQKSVESNFGFIKFL